MNYFAGHIPAKMIIHYSADIVRHKKMMPLVERMLGLPPSHLFDKWRNAKEILYAWKYVAYPFLPFCWRFSRVFRMDRLLGCSAYGCMGWSRSISNCRTLAIIPFEQKLMRPGSPKNMKLIY